MAVWIAARPVSGIANGYTFEHWCVKIQAPPSLISIDFLESDGRGKFGLSVVTAMEAELQDFLMYYVQHPQNGRIRKKWRIVSSVTPSPLVNQNYRGEFLDPHELSTLKMYMKAKKKLNNRDKQQPNNHITLQKIDTNKRVCDIVDFIEMWTESEKNGKRRDKPFNAVTSNCQQFALHLLAYLVGSHYSSKVEYAAKQTQSPHDIKLYKRKYSKQKRNNMMQNKEESKTFSMAPLIETDELKPTEELIQRKKDKIISNEAMKTQKTTDMKQQLTDKLQRKPSVSLLNDDSSINRYKMVNNNNVIFKQFQFETQPVHIHMNGTTSHAAILTGTTLYLVSVERYKLWSLFKVVSKIDTVTEGVNSILNHNFIKQFEQSTVIHSFLKNKTKNELKHYFLTIDDSDAILLAFKSFLTQKSEIVINITETQVFMIDILQFDKVKCFDNFGYGLTIDGGDEKIAINCKSNNVRHEMITRLDYIINYKKKHINDESDELKMSNQDVSELENDKYVDKQLKCTGTNCFYINRLLHFMKAYSETTLANTYTRNEEIMHIIVDCYHHCLLCHELKLMYENFIANNEIFCCKEQGKCTHRKRDTRNRNDQRERKLYHEINIREEDIGNIQLLDVIHCYLFHCYYDVFAQTKHSDKYQNKFMNN
eukprot:516558_1